MLHKNTVLPSQTQVLRYEEELLCLCSIKCEKIITQDKIEKCRVPKYHKSQYQMLTVEAKLGTGWAGSLARCLLPWSCWGTA